jgi:raffinose/stachyose/melibiose transport system permease protein
VKTNAQVGLNPFGFPEEIQWRNYVQAWKQGNFATTMRNSLFLMIPTVLITVTVAGMAAFALVRLKLPGADYLSFYFLVATGVPAFLYIIPLFFMWRQLGLINSHIGLIIIYVARNSPFTTYLLRSYMVTIPEEFVEASRIDGASHWQVFWRIIMPLSLPGFLTAGLIVGLSVWNEFLFAVTFLHRPELKPISTSLFAFQSRFLRDWALTNAGSVIMMLPVLILFLFLQRRFIEGMTQGGLKA